MTNATIVFNRNSSLKTMGLLCIAAMLASSANAYAAGPVVAGLTLSSNSAKVGQPIVVTVTATNTTNATIASAAMGVEIPMELTVGPVTQSPGRYRFASVLGKRLLYGPVANLAPGQTATFKFTVSAKNNGKYDFRSYARESYTTTDTFAYGTLTVR